MLPDTVPSPKAAEPFEAHLRRFSLPEPPASLGLKMEDVLGAEPIEARLLHLELPEPSATLDARMEALFSRIAEESPAESAPAVAGRAFWRRARPFAAAAAALAACASLALLLRPQAETAAPGRTPGPARTEIAATGTRPDPKTAASATQSPVIPYAVPVGYEYQGSRTVYARETPVGTLTSASGEPMRALRRDSLERHLYRDPKTQATLEVDAPREDVILENLQSY